MVKNKNLEYRWTYLSRGTDENNAGIFSYNFLHIFPFFFMGDDIYRLYSPVCIRLDQLYFIHFV